MAVQARIDIDTSRTRGRIDRKIYGQFVEHVGRAVYGGLFEPGSPLADHDGFRVDVLDAVRELAPSVLRWPGGNFASGYHWRDGIGARGSRPARHDLAWDAVETNQFGTEEFLLYCAQAGALPFITLNASTGSADEALAWLEYCNGVAPLPEVAARQAGPHPDPHGVRIWGIGNENYGWWQHGHTSASSYAEVAREWGKLLRWADPNVELIAVGAPDPDWNWQVLKEASPFVDFLSLHFYWAGGEDMYHATLAGPVASEPDIVAAYGMAEAARRWRGLGHRVRIAIDEWGVWSRTNVSTNVQSPPSQQALMRQGLSARSGIDTRFEEPYDLKDALAHASWLHVLWRHPEKVGLATQAQMVNALASICVTPEATIRHTVFWPMALAAAHAGPYSLDVAVRTSAEVDAPGVEGGSLPVLDAGGTADPSTGRVHLSLVNRSREEDLVVTVDGVGGDALVVRLAADDPFAGNTPQEPSRVVPVEEKTRVEGSLVLPPHSHTTVVIG